MRCAWDVLGSLCVYLCTFIDCGWRWICWQLIAARQTCVLTRCGATRFQWQVIFPSTLKVKMLCDKITSNQISMSFSRLAHTCNVFARYCWNCINLGTQTWLLWCVSRRHHFSSYPFGYWGICLMFLKMGEATRCYAQKWKPWDGQNAASLVMARTGAQMNVEERIGHVASG